MVTLCGLLVKVAFWSWVVSMTCNDWQNPCGSVLHWLIGSVVPSCVGCRGPEVEMKSRLDFKYSEIQRSKNQSLATSRTLVEHTVNHVRFQKSRKDQHQFLPNMFWSPKYVYYHLLCTCVLQLGLIFGPTKISSTKKKHTHHFFSAVALFWRFIMTSFTSSITFTFEKVMVHWAFRSYPYEHRNMPLTRQLLDLRVAPRLFVESTAVLNENCWLCAA